MVIALVPVSMIAPPEFTLAAVTLVMNVGEEMPALRVPPLKFKVPEPVPLVMVPLTVKVPPFRFKVPVPEFTPS